MHPTPLGAHVAQRGQRERRLVGLDLIGVNPPPINNYIVNGVCYDTVAYVRFLLGASITPSELLTLSGQQWGPRFNAAGILWTGGPIAIETAVLFRRPGTNVPFHLAISVGNYRVRAVNGNNLGAGWIPAGDSNVDREAVPVIPGQYNNLRCGPGAGDYCDVWLSNL